MDNEAENAPSPTLAALKSLKRATARARHALHQFRRYPTSPGTTAYLDKAKQELRVEYARVGEILVEEHLI